MSRIDELVAKADAMVARVDSIAGPAVVPITIECSGDFVPYLVRFLQIVRDVAAGGHSFDVVADQDQSSDYKDGPPKVGIDGDGSDRIHRILVSGKDVGKAEKFRK